MIVFTVYQSAVSMSGYIHDKIIPLQYLSKSKIKSALIWLEIGGGATR